MTRDLGDLMWGAVGERSQSLDGLTPDAGDLARLRSRVRRGRTVRHVREGAVAVPVVAALAAVGWFGLDKLDQPDPPPATQEPVVPTPDGDGDGDATDDADELVLGDPINEPGFPTYYAMPDGLLERTGPGWVLASYAPRMHGESPPAEIVFVVSPEGRRFAVARFEVSAGDSWVEYVPASWDGGPTAVVEVVPHVVTPDVESAEGSGYVELDLASGTLGGEVTLDPPTYEGDLRTVGPDGRSVTGVSYSDRYTLDPGEASARELRYGVDGRVCSAVGWLDAGSLLALCVDATHVDEVGEVDDPAGADPVYVRVPVDGATPEQLAAAPSDGLLPQDFAGAWVRDGVVVFPVVDRPFLGCWVGVDVWADGRLRPLQRADGPDENVFQVRAHGGLVYVEATGGCAGDEVPRSVTVHDLDRGTSLELLPARPADDGAWFRTLTGWAVAD